MKLSDNAKEWIKDLSQAVILAAAILFFFQPTVVNQHSMENTLQPNDYLFVSRQAYRIFGQPERGDIIVFQSDLPLNEKKNKLLIKRVIALPGDTIAITGGKVVLNGVVQEEPYTKDGYTKTEMEEITIPEGKLFAMGDNRQNSSDSRSSAVGLVDYQDLRGKAVLRLFPLKKAGGLYN